MEQQPGGCRTRDKVAFLSRPEAYPQERPAQVEVIETHMSWVFLTEQHAYKLKKPVRYDFLDFSTLEARGRDCAAEVRLNRRLAPDAYLGALPMNMAPDGRLSLGGAGEPVDWVVHMRRLPADRMLDRLIREGGLHSEDTVRLAHYLADFYARREPITVAPEKYRQRLLENVRHNMEALADTVHEIDERRLEHIRSAQLGVLRDRAALFDARAVDRRIVEGHGDLRPEHVCLEAKPVIFDCLEFNRRLRILDAADELAFLAMECERLGEPDVGETLFRVYGEVTGDWPEPRVIAFYKSSEACVRAKLALWHIFELPRNGWEKWRSRAESYLALADHYAEEM